MRNPFWTLLAIAAIVVWLSCGESRSLVAQEKMRSPVVTSRAEPVPKKEAPKEAANERVLVLFSGRVVKGQIRQSSTGYVVIKPEGQMVLPFEQVLLEADDMGDAYQQQRTSLPEKTAAAHTELARWCMTYHLLDQARTELREALRLDPSSVLAKNMLQRITDQQLTTNDLPRISMKNGQYTLLGDAKGLSTVDALGGLPREVASEFVSKVQPLLVNRCATAGCHGPGSDNSFELQRVKLGKGGSKALSQRNLAAVLDRIDHELPINSPLLTKLRGETKASGAKLPHGGLSQDQIQTLRTWIESVVQKPATEPTPEPVATTSSDVTEETVTISQQVEPKVVSPEQESSPTVAPADFKSKPKSKRPTLPTPKAK